MNNENRHDANSRVLSTDELDINGRVMWYTPDGIGHACDWKQLTIDARRMTVDWGGGINTIEFADTGEITVWLPRELSNADKTSCRPEVGNA